MYGYHSRVPARHAIVYAQKISLDDQNWRLRWPFLISTLIGVVLIIFSLVIFSLEIASLAKSTTNTVYNGVTYGRTASTGAGIWCGIFILAAGVLILMIDIVSRIRRWAAIAFIATLVAACFSIILIGLDAKAVQDGHDLSNINQIVNGSSYFQPKFRILSAQLAFACLVFLFCLVFITLYILVFVTTPKVRRPYQPGVLPPLRY